MIQPYDEVARQHFVRAAGVQTKREKKKYKIWNTAIVLPHQWQPLWNLNLFQAVIRHSDFFWVTFFNQIHKRSLMRSNYYLYNLAMDRLTVDKNILHF